MDTMCARLLPNLKAKIY